MKASASRRRPAMTNNWTLERKTRRASTLADFFTSSPLRDSALNVKRLKGKLRTPDT